MYYNIHLTFVGLLFPGLVDHGTAGIFGAQDGLICASKVPFSCL